MAVSWSEVDQQPALVIQFSSRTIKEALIPKSRKGRWWQLNKWAKASYPHNLSKWTQELKKKCWDLRLLCILSVPIKERQHLTEGGKVQSIARKKYTWLYKQMSDLPIETIIPYMNNIQFSSVSKPWLNLT